MALQQSISNSLELYDKIKLKNPTEGYTSLATISDFNSGKVLSLATGTQANYRKHPDDIQDCHAESLVRRAYKRYLTDRIKLILSDNKGNRNRKEVHETIIKECSTEVTLFVSQFPCGFINRYKGEEVRDSSGNVLKRKPGRGLEKDGKIYYVEKDDCFSKLKRWIVEGIQGKQIKEIFDITCKIKHIVLGNCEPNDEFEYRHHADKFKQNLSSDIPTDVSVDEQIRRDEFVFSSKKRPQPVAIVCWYSSQDLLTSCKPTKMAKLGEYYHEFIVDGRRIGLTKRQCLGQLYKLKVSNYCFKHDLALTEGQYRDLH